MIPAFIKPKNTCINPAKTTAKRKLSNDPKLIIAAETIAVRPAAGPLTPSEELDIKPTTIPPMIPAIIPENNGALLASAIPRHKGRATKKTTILAGISCLKVEIKVILSFLKQK